MSDQSHPTRLPDGLGYVWQDTLSNIEFLKSQQWRIANYTVLLLFGIASIAVAQKEIYVWERISLIAVVISLIGIEAVLIHRLQRSLTNKYRYRLKVLYDRYVDEEIWSQLRLHPDVRYKNSIEFLLAIGWVSLLTAIIAIYLWLRCPCSI